jgi:membrane protein
MTSLVNKGPSRERLTRRIRLFPVRPFWELLTATFWQWLGDDPFQLAAALAFYTFFSLAPLLIIVIAITGLVFGQEAAQNQIVGVLRGLVGLESAIAIQEVIRRASTPRSGLLATAGSVVTLLIGTGGVLGQLQASLNKIWGVAAKPWGGVWALLRERFVSFALVLGLGFLLLVSLLVSAALTAAMQFMSGVLPGSASLWQGLDMLVSFAFITLLFALSYKVLPDVQLAWREVWLGGAVTSLLFTIGKSLIGWYLGWSSVTSVYGAAGSLVVILLWVYYSALIFFFGAEFTQVYARTYGAGVVPAEHAVLAPAEGQTAKDLT